MNDDRLLIDTCTLIWLMSGQEICDEARVLIREKAENNLVFLNPFSAWEIAMLVAKKRLNLSLPVELWFEQVLKFPGFQLGELSVKTLIQSTQLPGTPPKDPADRIIIAYARLENMILVTRDRPILAYGALGYVRIMKC